MYNGIPIKITTPDAEGNYTQTETAVFATARKCPELSGKLKAVIKADIQEDAATAKSLAARRKLVNAGPDDDLDKLIIAAEESAMKLEESTTAYADAVHDFIVTGFKGAGYNDKQSERYAAFIDPERLDELKGKCLLGSGRLDFTKAPTRE